MALGVLLPVALLWFMSWWRSRIPGKPLLAILLPVLIEGRSVRRADTGGELAVRSSDQRLAPVPLPSGGTRRLELAEGVTLQVTMMRNPLDPHVVVEAPPGWAVASGAKPGRDGALARLPLAVHQQWLLLRDPAGATSILFLLAGMADQGAIDELVADARQRAPEVLADISPREGEPAMAGGAWDGNANPWESSAGRRDDGPEDPWGQS
jgi:hypothetical protein